MKKKVKSHSLEELIAERAEKQNLSEALEAFEHEEIIDAVNEAVMRLIISKNEKIDKKELIVIVDGMIDFYLASVEE